MKIDSEDVFRIIKNAKRHSQDIDLQNLCTWIELEVNELVERSVEEKRWPSITGQNSPKPPF